MKPNRSPVIPSHPRTAQPHHPRPNPSVPLARTLLVAGLVAFASPLRAADCKLEVRASTPVVGPGESAQINVLAHFPASAFAFAEADLDVFATQPAWTYASSGILAGANVLGIHVEQTHSPGTGVLADPSNPIRLWAGRLTPDSDAPAFINVAALSTGFAYYPSALTPSSVACPAAPGQAWLFANPLYVGKVAGAPGPGTTLEAGPDAFVAESPTESILIGLLLPAVQNGRKGEVGLDFDRRPASLELRVLDSDGETALEEVSFNYTKIPWTYDNTSTEGYAASLRGLPPGTPVEVEVLRHGRRLARFRGESGPTLFSISRLPDAFSQEARLEPRTGWGASAYQYGFEGTYDLSPGHPGGVNVAFGDGSVRFVRNATEVRVQANRLLHGNNLKQIGLACHSYEIHGAGKVSVSPLAP